MASEAGAGGAGVTALERGPFVLRSLLDNVPLSADGTEEDIHINCVDYYGEGPSLFFDRLRIFVFLSAILD